MPSVYTTSGKVHQYLCDNGYLVNDGMWSKKVVNGGFTGLTYSKGMNTYLKDRGITTWKAYFQTYSFAKIKTLINADRPVVTASDSAVPPEGNWNEPHAYVVHGYSVGYDGVPYLKINNTFGSNNVTINASASYHPGCYDGMCWFE